MGSYGLDENSKNIRVNIDQDKANRLGIQKDLLQPP
jgi:multidrug efflux pump subunit AcrB